MFKYVLLAFILIPAIEIGLFVEIGSVIGGLNTIMIIMLTGVLGAYLWKIQGFEVIQRIQNQIKQGQSPQGELIEGILILIGGLVLITPGFFTDFLGMYLLIPVIRKRIINKIRGFYYKNNQQGYSNKKQKFNRYKDIDI